jgi:hypothetical protein
MIDPLRSLSKVQPISDFTGPALLSGMQTRKGAKKIGVLYDIGNFGFLTFKDFTSQLSGNDGSVGENIKILRELYDGHYDRPVGTSPEPLYWYGKLGIVGATTSAIDAHHQVIAEMGERFLFYRMPATADDERLAKTEAALVADVEDPDADDALSAAVAKLQPTLDALFDKAPPVAPTATERTHLARLADLVARCRSSVPRRGTTMELTHLPDTEEGPRAGVELQRLWMGLRALGAGADEAMALATKVGGDSIPSARSLAIEVLAGRGPFEAITAKEAVEGTGVDPRTMLRPLADLAYRQVVEATYTETVGGPRPGSVWRQRGEALGASCSARPSGRRQALSRRPTSRR